VSEHGRIPADRLAGFARDSLLEAGWSVPDAELIAGALLESSLRGIDSHGVIALLAHYARAARDAADAPAATVVHDAGAATVLDGHGGLGLRTARRAVELAVGAARRHGVGAVAARNVGYLGALWWSVEPGARDGAVTLAMCTSEACVAPHGGREALHGTNPIAAAVPREPDPIVIDMRTNAFRMADYWASVASGAPLPAGGLIDTGGRPLISVARMDEAIYLPLAGAKGYALALLVDVLASGLAAGPVGRELDGSGSGVTAFFLALDPDAFGGTVAFADTVRRLADQVAATAPVDPAEPVRLPGERALAERERRLADGVPVNPQLFELLDEELTELGIGVPRPRLEGGIGG
jgi:LDH2 family malate/lactate/ureidoglycolate dehydrogenase